jgi:hypothetical protein
MSGLVPYPFCYEALIVQRERLSEPRWLSIKKISFSSKASGGIEIVVTSWRKRFRPTCFQTLQALSSDNP